jgi:hypothetical protein
MDLQTAAAEGLMHTRRSCCGAILAGRDWRHMPKTAASLAMSSNNDHHLRALVLLFARAWFLLRL